MTTERMPERLYYILGDDGEAVETDPFTWADWFETSDTTRQLAHTVVGPYLVSTVFLGLNLGWDHDVPPLVWETMVFRDGHGCDCRRYATRREALDGHRTTCQLVELEHEKGR